MLSVKSVKDVMVERQERSYIWNERTKMYMNVGTRTVAVRC